MAGERTEAPTPRRRREARERGQVSKSQEVVSIGVLFAAVVAMRLLGPALLGALRSLMSESLGHQPDGDLTQASATELGRHAGGQALLALAPLLGVLALAAVALNVAQTGFLVSSAGLSAKLDRINPGAGFKRIVSVEGLMGLAKALLKMAVIAVVVWMTMKARLAEISALGTLSVGEGGARLASLAFDIAIRAAAVLFVLALGDYAWQRRRFMNQLRMTKEELKQEFRETEGDPQIKAAVRRRRAALMNRMIAAVPKADVVVTNPTHYAVALRYDPVKMHAPQVVAKGERLLADRIRDVARKAGVPVLEEPPLARALFAAVAVGQYVPANLFHAVAEVLAWVYALRSKQPFAGRRSQPARGGA